MSKVKNPDKLNAEELGILEACNSGKLQGAPVSEPMMLAAKETLKKIRIRLFTDIA